eukprot:187002-Pleurochrysis_carterae.AAC.1
MNNLAAAARKATRLVRGDDEANDDPRRALHAITNIFEEGRRAMDAVVRKMMNITDDMAATDAKKVKAMRTRIVCFSSTLCALIYQCSKYVALHSSKGFAIGAKFWQWLDVELHGKEEESFNNELLGSVEDMWRSAALATTSSSSTRQSLSAFRRPAACKPTLRRRPTLAPRLVGSCAARFSPALAPRAFWRRCARWP